MVTGEKRNSEEERMMEKVTAILLDIEGTTTSISFVKDKLFPYVREHLQAYIDSHWDDDEFKQDLQTLKDLAKKDAEEKIEGLVAIEDGDKEKESLVKNILWQMDSDRKTTALKQLQGHIWREGYKNGKLKGHIYDDVASCFKKWSEDGRRLFIYSSGSVEAQKLLFGNTEEGDLLELLAGHYDTTVGPKTESASYTNIAKSIGCDSEQILFLTDVVKEAQAAKTAGMQTLIVVREGNAVLSEDEKKEFVTVTSFKDIIFESSAKKKKMSNGEESVEEPEKIEKVEKMESEPAAEKKELNGDEVEKMDVDASAEETKEETTKPEISELKEDCKEKTVEKADNKTEDKIIIKETEESKTESDEVVVDVTSDDNKGKKQEEKIEKVESDKTNEIIPEKKSKEVSDKTPEEPVKDEEVKKADSEAVKENNEAPVAANEETKVVEEKEKGEVVAEGEKKEAETPVEDKKDVEKPVEVKEAEKPAVEDKKEKEKGEVVDDVKEVKESAETNDAKPEVKEDKPVENNKNESETKEQAAELNGKTNGKENGVAEKEEEEAITVKKVIPEETEAAAIEVQA